jgi:hypothetical protein
VSDETEKTIERPDPRTRPPDPAGTRPRFDPESLLPATRAPLLRPTAGAGVPIDVHGVELGDDGDDLLPRVHEPAGAPEGPRRRPPEPPGTARLQFALGALIAVGLAGLALLALVIARPDDSSGPAGPSWSTWRPAAGGVDGAKQIAEHVGRRYRFAGGRQLVAVEGGKLEFEGVPLDIALRETPTQGGDIRFFDDGGILYRMCGLGPNCSIDRGKPSTERGMLLRREALELALYTFRYLKDANSVVVFIPPPPPKKANDPVPRRAVFFRKGDVRDELARPLTASLSSRTPPVTKVNVWPDAPLVSSTTPVFDYSLTAANTENRGFIVLDPPQAATTTTTTTTPEKATPKKKAK